MKYLITICVIMVLSGCSRIWGWEAELAMYQCGTGGIKVILSEFGSDKAICNDGRIYQLDKQYWRDMNKE